MNPLMQISEVSVKVCFVGRPRQPVHAGGSFALECQECFPEQIDADVVEECSEPLLLPLPCGLPYALQRLCHALPSLCPVRAFLAPVPLGPCPWLHRLRCGPDRFVPTLRRGPHGQLRMTRGRCGSLLLHRKGLAPSTPCRSPGASQMSSGLVQ